MPGFLSMNRVTKFRRISPHIRHQFTVILLDGWPKRKVIQNSFINNRALNAFVFKNLFELLSLWCARSFLILLFIKISCLFCILYFILGIYYTFCAFDLRFLYLFSFQGLFLTKPITIIPEVYSLILCWPSSFFI